MTDIKWQEPPMNRRSRGSKWTVIAEALKERPGEWALVATGTGAAYIAARMGDGFEVISRTRQDGGKGRDVYARFVGGESA